MHKETEKLQNNDSLLEGFVIYIFRHFLCLLEIHNISITSNNIF